MDDDRTAAEYRAIIEQQNSRILDLQIERDEIRDERDKTLKELEQSVKSLLGVLWLLEQEIGNGNSHK